MKSFPEKPDKQFWNNLYLSGTTGWDIGYIATPIKEYFDQVSDKSKKILIPGAGNSYEAEYLFQHGFKNIFILDFAEKVIQNFKLRVPNFPDNQIIKGDFFEHNGQYDIIVELTFFSSLHPKLRTKYVNKMHKLLKPKGKLIGLLFNHLFNNSFPPFGGSIEEYQNLFSNKFIINIMEIAYNSIKPRQGRELFINYSKKYT